MYIYLNITIERKKKKKKKKIYPVGSRCSFFFSFFGKEEPGNNSSKVNSLWGIPTYSLWREGKYGMGWDGIELDWIEDACMHACTVGEEGREEVMVV